MGKFFARVFTGLAQVWWHIYNLPMSRRAIATDLADDRIRLRVSQEEKAFLVEKSREKGISLSAYLRRKLGLPRRNYCEEVRRVDDY
jgi:hypothetical protein